MIIFQRRNLGDSPLPLARYLPFLSFRQDCEFYFLLVGRTTTETDVSGELCDGRLLANAYVFSGTKLWRERLEARVKQFQEDAHDKSTPSQEALRDCEAMHEKFLEYCMFHTQLEVSRQGCTYLCPTGVDPDVTRSPEFLRVCDDPKEVEAMANQVFRFLRDLSHKHVFHSPPNDNITYAHPGSKEATEDIEWRRRTLKSLYRTVLAYKRTPNESTCVQSLGVLSYLETFEAISVDQVRRMKERSPKRNHSALRQTIELAKENDQVVSKRTSRSHDLMLIISIGALGLAIGITQLIDMPNSPNVSPYILSFAETVYANPLMVAAVLVTLSAGIVYHESANTYLRSTLVFKNFIRLALSLGPSASKWIVWLLLPICITLMLALAGALDNVAVLAGNALNLLVRSVASVVTWVTDFLT